MSYSHPRYGLVSPDNQTKAKDLGVELKAMGTSIVSALDSFDYSGADPNLVLARVAALEAALTARRRTVGGSNSMTLPASNGLRSFAFDLPLGLEGTPAAVVIQSRNPLGHKIEWRISGKNATTFTVEARALGIASSVLFEFDWIAVR